MNIKKTIILLTLCLAIFSCNKVEEVEEVIIPEVKEEVVKPEPVVEVIEEVEEPKFNLGISDKKLENTDVVSNIDLLEEVLFSTYFDTEEIGTADSYAIIASHKSKLYPVVPLESNEDLVNLKDGVSIPIGTIIPLEKEIQLDTDDWNKYFVFENNYNSFYETTINGVKGLVFGADLKLGFSSIKSAKKLAYFYSKEVKAPDFTPFNGKRDFDIQLKENIINDRIAFEKVSPKEYRLNFDNPDDMVSLYKKEFKSRENTVFITTDLMVHSLHLIFNNFLQSIEEKDMLPGLNTMVDTYLTKIKEYKAADTNEFSNYSELLTYVENYFNVAKVLLNYTEDEAVINELLSTMPEEVAAEYQFIKAHQGFSLSPILGYKEDYSQYVARGHYTKNDNLKAYFMSMMWFGRINMLLTTSTAPVTDTEGNITADNSDEAAFKGTSMCLLINKITKEDESLYKLWQSLFDPITYLVGESDDLSFYDTFTVLDMVNLDEFPKWIDSRDNVNAFATTAGEKLRAPQISGNSVFQAPSPDNVMPPLGFRLFGQRFTYDSSVHMKLSDPRLNDRAWVNGLDIMAALGSQSAKTLLEQSESDAPYWEEYKETLGEFETFFKDADDDFWAQTYYNRYLDLIGKSGTFEQGSGFYFTQKPKWNLKALNSAHGAWAELRHDTILYVKQVYAERAGGGEEGPTFRTIKFDRPIHYVEPNIKFFYALNDLLVDTTEKINFSSPGSQPYREKFRKLAEISSKLTKVVEAEILDEPISKYQNDYIVTVPSVLARIVLTDEAGMAGYIEDTDTLKMAIIADVFTQSDEGKVLEIGTGIPHRIYVALNDSHGGKRIATGYTFSYYEFKHPMNDRLTNEKWREEVYNTSSDLTKRLPFWAKDTF